MTTVTPDQAMVRPPRATAAKALSVIGAPLAACSRK